MVPIDSQADPSEAGRRPKVDTVPISADAAEIRRRLEERGVLMDAARKYEHLPNGAAVVLQRRRHDGAASSSVSVEPPALDGRGALIDGGRSTIPEIPDGATGSAGQDDTAEMVRYRLAVTDLFVEKAQFHLERRADRYERFGNWMYLAAIALFICGAVLAVCRMLEHDGMDPQFSRDAALAVAPLSGPVRSAAIVLESPGSAHQAWIDLLLRFVLAFTAYGFIVLAAVALVRGARACLDQRERLLAKRHSLRQGRLYLHLTGGNVTIAEMERAFNWNHEQVNAFTEMLTDAKAPWGMVLGEVVKAAPELVKAGVTAAKDSTDRKDEKKPG